MKDLLEFTINPRNFVALVLTLIAAHFLRITGAGPIITMFIPIVVFVNTAWWGITKLWNNRKPAQQPTKARVRKGRARR